MATANRIPLARTLAERLEAVRHRHLDLNIDEDDDFRRPNLSIWPAADQDNSLGVVSFVIEPMFGQQERYLDLTPDEARTLARHLTETADLIDQEVAAGSVS